MVIVVGRHNITMTGLHHPIVRIARYEMELLLSVPFDTIAKMSSLFKWECSRSVVPISQLDHDSIAQRTTLDSSG